MASIAPIPTTRVGDFFARQRLITQVQSDQLDLFRLQSQVSSGQRLQLPSDDAPAALRAIGLQRLLARNTQITTNLQSSQVYLSTAESNLSGVSQQLNDLRGAVLSVSGSVSTDQERTGVIQQIDQLLQSLVNTGNAKAQDRHLFAGSRSQVSPYHFNGEYVEYQGNESYLRSFVELSRLVETNLPGTDVFGGISEGVEGSADLDPHLTNDMLLSSINGGRGIGSNAAISVTVNSGGTSTTSVVDLSLADTIGDVARLIEANAPSGSTLRVEAIHDGLTIETNTGTVRISEVADGRTAHELGIYSDPNSVPGAQIVGSDLVPTVLNTTSLDSLLGTKARAIVQSTGGNNDLVVTAHENGTSLNGVTVQFAAGGSAGSEVVTYDEIGSTLTIQIEDGTSTAAQVAAAITAEGTFTAEIDPRDAVAISLAGTGVIALSTTGITSGGSGEVLDVDSGLVLTNGGDLVTLDISEAETVEDLLNLINGADLGLLAQINAERNGINVRSRLSGADLTIGENGGTTATQLGIRTYTESTKLAEFNRGLGIGASETGDDLLITARDGTELSVDLAGAISVADVLDRINSHADNNTGTTAVLAQLTSDGNGIELVDASTATTGDFIVQTVSGSQAAELLGFVAEGDTQVSTSTVDGSGNFVLSSEDRHTLETDSVFNTLIRLRSALYDGDLVEIGRGLERLDEDMERVTFARSDIGNRLQGMDIASQRLELETIGLQTALSEDLDADLVEAISNLMARQSALEASLQTTANLLQLSILNFI